jgi:ferredoxin--NADP+ reductase
LFEIIDKKILAPGISWFEIKAPRIAVKREAGQFVIVRLQEKGERIPLTIVDSDPEKGTIVLAVQEIGKTTAEFQAFETGDQILDIVGPLGKPTPIEKLGTTVVIGGGVGTAEAYPIAKALKRAGNNVISIIGARNKELVIMEEDMAAVSSQVRISTDDGSYGVHGFVTDALQQYLDEGLKIDLVVAIGPVPMMKAVCNVTRPHSIKTLVSLNSIMIDATGMCGACRVSIDGKTKFACVDGPEFDGHKVDFDELTKRVAAYVRMEKESYDLYKQSSN